MTIVVGGSSRKAGKTTVICEIIGATPEAQWTAIKITPHAHEPGLTGDTERYLAAGAVKSVLVNKIPAMEGNVIVESNRILDVLTPDLFVFVEGPDWKPNAVGYARRADVVVQGHATPSLIVRIRQMLSEQR